MKFTFREVVMSMIVPAVRNRSWEGYDERRSRVKCVCLDEALFPVELLMLTFSQSQQIQLHFTLTS